MATPLRYIAALTLLAESGIHSRRVFARQVLRDLGCPGVSIADYLHPYMTLPHTHLDDNELALRKLAEGCAALTKEQP